MDVSLGIGTTGSHVPYESLMRARAVFTPDAARNGNQVILRACPGRMGSPRFRRRLIGFRRFSNGSLALAFPHRACRDLVSTFLQRSPPSLFTTAACSGLKPAPDRRLRGAHPHLSYSIAPPYVGTFVTHSQKETSWIAMQWNYMLITGASALPAIHLRNGGRMIATNSARRAGAG